MLVGYLCKQILKKYKSCVSCEEAIKSQSTSPSPVSQLVDMKSRGKLIHADLTFFNLIRQVEACFTKYCSCFDVFDLIVDEVFTTHKFSFPCTQHASEILSYAIVYYIRLRMRQYTYQQNQNMEKQFVRQKNYRN